MDLVIRHLWKTYPNGVVALQDVSLTIPPGLFGLLGPNGAGKSTLMRILSTLQEADAGSAQLGAIDVLREHEAVRRTLGYLPQEFGLYPRATAEQMLDHFALLKGIVNARERRDTVAALLQQTNLWQARRQKLGGFSGGMRQRFGIAVALIGNPRLIIVDEPTAGLDPAERARFLNLLSELGENAVVILSTHIVEDVSDLCTRMAVIESGRILLEGEPARAVAAVRGRIWRRQVDRADLPRYEQAMPVISTTLVGGRTVIHVHADAPPDATFEPVEPDLKDVYFTVIRGIRLPLAPAAPAPIPAPDTPAPAAREDQPISIQQPLAPTPTFPPPPFAAQPPAPSPGEQNSGVSADGARAPHQAVAPPTGPLAPDPPAETIDLAAQPRAPESGEQNGGLSADGARTADQGGVPGQPSASRPAAAPVDGAVPPQFEPPANAASRESSGDGARPQPHPVVQREVVAPPPVSPPASPGSAHVPRFGDVLDATAGVSRENRDAVEAPRTDGGAGEGA